MILSCNNISKSFGTDIILSNCSFNIENHEKAAIVGPNGAGKSTLLKIIVGELPSDTGVVTLAKDTTLGYLAQHQNLTSENTIYDELLTVKQDIIDMENKIRSMEADMNNLTGEALENLLNQYTRLNHEFELKNGYAYKSEIYGVLKGLGFTEEDFSLCVNTLSGGQKTRVALGKLLLSKPDIILLDEPTNHLDIISREALEDAILEYDGTLMVISHDRYFLNKVISRILELKEDGVSEYLGNYSYYKEKKLNPSRFESYEELANGKTKTQLKDEKKKKREAEKEAKAIQLKIKNLEKTISEKEDELNNLQEQLCLESIYSNPSESQRVNNEIKSLEQLIANLYDEWESLA